MKSEINAHGLSSAKIQQAIDEFIDYQHYDIVEAKKKVREMLYELISRDDVTALEVLKIIQEHHPKLLGSKTINPDAVIDLDITKWEVKVAE